MNRKLLVAIGVMLVVGLGVGAAMMLGGPASDGPIAQNRALWASQGLDDYTFVLERSCFCIFREPVEIVVADGRTESVSIAETGETETEFLVLSEEFRSVDTIDKLFDLLQESVNAGFATVDVTFDPTYGHPIEIFIDQDKQMADEEVWYTIQSLTPSS